MACNRKSILKSLLTGLLSAIAFTIAAMFILAAMLVWLHLSNVFINIANQIIKIAAVLIGTCIAVPRGSLRGFATGLLIALAYIAAGYSLYVTLGGSSFSFTGMLGEMMVSCAVGTITGAVRANMIPRSRMHASKL